MDTDFCFRTYPPLQRKLANSLSRNLLDFIGISSYLAALALYLASLDYLCPTVSFLKHQYTQIL